MFLDIETSPNIVSSWRVGFKINLTPDNIIKEREIICVCWKWAGKKEVHSLDWGSKMNDKSLLKKFIKELDKADVAIGHNGDKFDIKWLKTRILHHGLDPITNIQTIDTLKLARNNFYLNSNRLDYIARFLGVGSKMETGGFSLWKDACNGSKKALNKMVKYCKQDVIILEKVFDKIKAHSNNMPVHMGVINNDSRLDCPQCSGKAIFYGYTTTRAGKYRKRKCTKCSHVWRHFRMVKD